MRAMEREVVLVDSAHTSTIDAMSDVGIAMSVENRAKRAYVRSHLSRLPLWWRGWHLYTRWGAAVQRAENCMLSPDYRVLTGLTLVRIS